MTSRSTSLRWLGICAAMVAAFVLGRWTVRSPHVVPVGDGASSGNASPLGSSSATQPATTVSPTTVPSSPAGGFVAMATRSVGSLAAEEERQRAIEQWAAVDPRAAMDFARKQLKGDRQAQAVAAVLAIWGKNDPDAAWNWVSTETPSATHHFDTLLEVFGRNSTATAARFAAQYAAAHPEAAVEVHLAALLGVTYRGDFAGARSMIDNNPALDATTRANLNNFVAGQWARFAPQEASAWAMSLPAGPARDQALIGLGESWSDVDPAGAAAFAVTLSSGPSRVLALRQAISKWVLTDPEAARNWVVNAKPHEDFDQALGSIATDPNFVRRDPARALQWTGIIFEESLRTRAVDAIFFNWYPADPAAATAYLQSSREFTPEQKTELLARLQGNK